MYNHLVGILIEKSPTRAVIEANGVGFDLLTPLSTYHELPEVGQNCRLLTYLQVREDAHQLFGFFTEEERILFRLLITVSGIGPKMAITVLSGLELDHLKRAIIDENLTVLTSVSGIGRKTAERIIIELREKVLLDEKIIKRRVPDKSGQEEALIQDTISALVSLGYRKQNAQDAIQKALTHSAHKKLSVEELVRASLKVL